MTVANLNTDYLVITQDISFRNDFSATKVDPHSILHTEANNEIVSDENLTYDNNTLSASNVTISNDLVLSDLTPNTMLFVDGDNKVIGVNYSEEKLLLQDIEANNVHLNEDVILENKTANSVLFIDTD